MNVRSEMHNIDSKSNHRDYLSTVLRSHERKDTTRRSISDASEVEPKSRLDDSKVKKLGSKISATIPVAKKADLKAKVSVLQNQVIKAKKKIAEENIQKAIKVAIETAEVAASDGKAFCISRVNVGLDTTARHEAVVKVMDEKGIAVMVFSTYETANKALVCAGVLEKGDKCKQLKVLEWLVASLKPLKGKGGGGKGGLAQGQVWSFEGKNQSIVYVGVNGTLESLIYVEDQIREDGRHVESLHEQGVSLYMLSGDKRSTVEYVASKVGIPREKIKKLMHNICQYQVPLRRYMAMMDIQVVFGSPGVLKRLTCLTLSWGIQSSCEVVKWRAGFSNYHVTCLNVLTILVIENLERNVDSMVWVLKACASLDLRLIYVLQDLYFLVV